MPEPEPNSTSLSPIEQAQSLLSLAEKDRRAAELAFEKLGFDKQVETALALSGDQLHEWLMLAEDYTELVRALPPEHLHDAVRLIGEEDAIQLLQASSSDQLQQMLDIEWYTENKLDKKKVRRWLELLMQLDEDEADQALQGLDLNALASFLRPLVKPAVDKDNLLLALHLNQRYLFTPEDLYTDDDLSQKFLDYLYAVDRDLFGEVMGLLIGEEEDIVEADMYAGREDRLLKRGFAPIAEAEFLLEIVNARAYGIEWPTPVSGERSPSTELVSQPRATAPFLLHALAWGRSSGALGERTEREFIKESASLANSLLLAHTKDTADPAARSLALVAVQVLSSISLEALASSNLNIAIEKLKSHELRELFQLGWSLTREVAKDAWILAMDDRIADSKLARNLKWLPPEVRTSVLEAEDLMSWRRIAATASPENEGGQADAETKWPRELLTWPKLCRLRWGVWEAQSLLSKTTG